MACGMEAEDDFGLGRFFDAQPLGADGHAPIGADFEECAHAPDVIPPGAARSRAQDGALFFFAKGSVLDNGYFPPDFLRRSG